MALITYDDKVALNENASIPNINKVNASDMNQIKTGVNTNESNIGNLAGLNTTDKTSVVNAINELKNAEVYSTSEVKTNKTWIDGKPIYRKVIDTGQIASATKNVAHGISNIGVVVKLEGKAYSNYRNAYYVLPRVAVENLNQQIDLYCGTTNITMEVGSNANFNSSFVIVEYTKTTD